MKFGFNVFEKVIDADWFPIRQYPWVGYIEETK